jgi:molybdopterin molybdotransferase
MEGVKNLPVEEARARILTGAAPGPFEQVPLLEAHGRVLAQDIKAARDQPPFRASAMDGWAVRAEDAPAEVSLRIAGESAAGRGYEAALQPGEAVRIFTGAPVPDGADHVVIQEEATREGETVRLGPVAHPRNIRAAGSDFRSGDVLLTKGMRLDPWRISLAASAGAATLACAPRPRLAILATGEELAPPGTQPGPWAIFESNSQGLKAWAEALGAEVERLDPARDDVDAIAEAVSASKAELVATVGGASVGDYDLVKPAMARLGLRQTVGSVTMRPGKPTWFGTFGEGRRVLGLPGNPASAFVAAELFLRPLILALQGAEPGPKLIKARLAAALPANGGREHWMRAALSYGEDGVLSATPFPEQDSSMVGVLAQADALLRRPIQAPAAVAGDIVDVLRLDRL